MLNGRTIAALSRPTTPERGKDYQGAFTLTAGQELEMVADGQDRFIVEVPDGKVWQVSIRLNVLEQSVET